MNAYAVELIMLNNRPVAIKIDSIPEPMRTEFEASLRGSQVPIIGSYTHLAYWLDWVRWNEYSLCPEPEHVKNQREERDLWDERS